MVTVADDSYHSYPSLFGCSALRFNLHLAWHWCIETAMVVGWQTIPHLLHHFYNHSMTDGPMDQPANCQPTHGPTNQRADILSAIAASKKARKMIHQWEIWYLHFFPHVGNAFFTCLRSNQHCVSTDNARKLRLVANESWFQELWFRFFLFPFRPREGRQTWL